MKIYLFHPETGLYLGEDFADERAMQRGEYLVPPDATVVAPPPVQPGEMPVFDVGRQQWDVQPAPVVVRSEG